MSRPPGTMHSCLELLEPRRLLSSAIIYVDLNPPGPAHDRSSWQQAYVDLQDALAAARAGDQIRVADGTYSPGTNFGDRFQLKDGTATRGGYAGYGAANPDARDVNAFRTILTSNNYGNDIGVVSADGTGRGTILDGFTIKTVGWIQVGITNVGGAPTISNCTFTGGAGIDNSDGASPVISNCTFTDGEGAIPGAIGLFNASALITGCTFVRYHGVFGGALYSYRSSMIVRNCTFTRNTAAHEGQAVWLYESTATFQDCDFTRNGEATEAGGATLRNSILWGNRAAVAADEICPSDPSHIIFDHSIVRGAGPFSHRFVRDPDPGADATWGTADDDYGDLRPTIDSDAIDAGSNKLVPRRIRTDLAGDRRLVGIPDRGAPGRGVDIGAYELQRTRRASADKLVIRAPRPAPAIDFHGAVDATNLRLAELFE